MLWRTMRTILSHLSDSGAETVLMAPEGPHGPEWKRNWTVVIRRGEARYIFEADCVRSFLFFIERTGCEISGDTVTGAVVHDREVLRRLLDMLSGRGRRPR